MIQGQAMAPNCHTPRAPCEYKTRLGVSSCERNPLDRVTGADNKCGNAVGNNANKTENIFDKIVLLCFIDITKYILKFLVSTISFFNTKLYLFKGNSFCIIITQCT